MSTQESNSKQCFPTLCKNGCGFFSSIDAKGFCSVCYKDFLKKEAAAGATVESNHEEEVPTTVANAMSQLTLEEETKTEEAAEIVIPDLEATASALPSTSSDQQDAEGEKEKDPKDTKKKKNRCLSCKKKLGLTGFSCRCGGLYCAIHRYSDKHECGFDYKAMGEKEISENNPLIVAQKVAKI
eukprot:TRINITY_DN2898_c0_g1_i1.p1 TRINITY_DN2898_c0_g1~~TRINITY_DN2898_c0_g1_i1.p1  ORF type:complete len:183 (-),score=46.82 TRINITY_DN2898_c0_g1_i1:188-736(-)